MYHTTGKFNIIYDYICKEAKLEDINIFTYTYMMFPLNHYSSCIY